MGSRNSLVTAGALPAPEGLPPFHPPSHSPAFPRTSVTHPAGGRDRVFFAFFLVSGACSLVYEVIWLRLAMAAFGVTTPLVSIVLSVFMAGLALGSWGGGRLARSRGPGAGVRALSLYALAELLIGSSGLLVARELQWGRRALESLGGGAEWGSSGHYLASGFFVALALLPFCTAMGATFPLAIGALRGGRAGAAGGPFSYLYLANVVGAAAGTIVSALFLIELLGFRNTLLVAAGHERGPRPGGLLPQPSSRIHGRAGPPPDPRRRGRPRARLRGRDGGPGRSDSLAPVHDRLPVDGDGGRLGPPVHAVPRDRRLCLRGDPRGLPRRHVPRLGVVPPAGPGGRQEAAGGAVPARALFLAALLCLLPLVLADPRLAPSSHFALGIARIAAALGPFCFAVGYLTPMLVDRWSGDDPAKAGSVYALNVLGCILGPLAASFVLLPALSERWSLAVLSVPLTAFGVALRGRAPSAEPPQAPTRPRRAPVPGHLPRLRDAEAPSLGVRRRMPGRRPRDRAPGPRLRVELSAAGGPPRLQRDRDRHGARDAQAAPGQRLRDDRPDADHQDDGAPPARASARARPATRSSSASAWAPVSAPRSPGGSRSRPSS